MAGTCEAGMARPDPWHERGGRAPTKGISVSTERNKAEEKDKQVVVSVRFPSHLLDRIQALAAVLSTTANAVIRDGMEAHVKAVAASPDFKKASEQYIAEAQARVAAVLQDTSKDDGLRV
jgi:predicted DNA-binding protein